MVVVLRDLLGMPEMSTGTPAICSPILGRITGPSVCPAPRLLLARFTRSPHTRIQTVAGILEARREWYCWVGLHAQHSSSFTSLAFPERVRRPTA